MPIELSLESLDEGIPVIPEGEASFYKNKSIVCLDGNGHASGVPLTVENGGAPCDCVLNWDAEVTDQLRLAHVEKKVLAEFGAYAIAFLILREMTQYTALQQAAIGTTVDYYLTDRIRDDDLLFNNTARLEVSGIYKESGSNTIGTRLKQKTSRLLPDTLPAYIIVVEFGTPKAKMVVVP